MARSTSTIASRAFSLSHSLISKSDRRDGSLDRTIDIARRYEARDSRVRVVENDRNHGLAGNWNRCAVLARGEWIKFVFQDDLILPACLERMLGAAQAATAFVAC